MPAEARKFARLDDAFIRLMQTAQDTKQVVQCCETDSIRQTLPGLLRELEQHHRKLQGYLEHKRRMFPRFYFVSNSTLLTYLSQGSDPMAVQHLYDKVFPAVRRVIHSTGSDSRDPSAAADSRGSGIAAGAGSGGHSDDSKPSGGSTIVFADGTVLGLGSPSEKSRDQDGDDEALGGGASPTRTGALSKRSKSKKSKNDGGAIIALVFQPPAPSAPAAAPTRASPVKSALSGSGRSSRFGSRTGGASFEKFQRKLAQTALREREELRLSYPVEPSGNVESWLADVERAMQVSVRDGCLEASELATSWANGEVATTYAVRMLSS